MTRTVAAVEAPAMPVPGHPARHGAARRRDLAACVVLALALRVAGLLAVNHPEIRQGRFGLSADEPSFYDTAVALATTGAYSRGPGGPPTAFRPPAAVLPLAAIFALVGPSPYLAVAWVMLCGLGVVVVAHRLGGALADRRTALISALLAAVMPTLVFTASGIWSEPQATLLVMLALGLLVSHGGVPPTGAPWAAVGLCLALAYLTRQSAGFLVPVVAGGALLLGPRGRGLIHAALVIAVFLLPVAVWGVRNRVTMGEFIFGATVSGEALWGSNNLVTAGLAAPALPTNNGFDLEAEARARRYLGSWVPMTYIPGWDAGPSEMDVYHRQLESMHAFVRAHPGAWLRLLGWKAVRLLTLEPYAPSITRDVGTRRVLHRVATLLEYWFMLVWGGIGMVRLLRTRPAVGWWYAAFIAAGLASVMMTYPNPRFLLPVTSVLIPPAALAIAAACDRLLVSGPAPTS